MIFLKSFSSLFRTGPLHQRRVLSYHTALLVSTVFSMFFDMGSYWCGASLWLALPALRKRKRFLAPFEVTTAERLYKAALPSSLRTEREIFFACGGQAVLAIMMRRTSKTPYQKTWKKQLTQEGQYGKIIPVADEAAPFERAMKKISKKSFDKPLRMW